MMPALEVPSKPGYYLLTPAGWAGPYPNQAAAREAGRHLGLSITRKFGETK